MPFLTVLPPKISKWFRFLPRDQRMTLLDVWANHPPAQAAKDSIDEIVCKMFDVARKCFGD